MWNKIFFDAKRYSFKGFTLREWNNRRLSAAKRSLKKEKEKAGLFPELMKFNSVEERVEQMDNMLLQRVKQFRDSAAKDIWECRKRFRSLPDNIKNDVIEYWNKSIAPKEPFRFLSLIHRWQVDPLHFEREKGNVSKYTRTIISDGCLKIIEISKDEYWSNLKRIDSKD